MILQVEEEEGLSVVLKEAQQRTMRGLVGRHEGRNRVAGLVTWGEAWGDSKATRVLIVDYNDERREQLRKLLEANFRQYVVSELKTSPPNPPEDTDTDKLAQIRTSKADLLIGHIGGNPSGYDCIQAFKEHNPQGKAVLYTKQEAIPLEQFDSLKLANALVKRSDNDRVLFENQRSMMKVIHNVMEEPGIVFWRSPFREPKVLATISGSLALAVISFAADIARLTQVVRGIIP
jgi:hypothetical protein